MLALAGPNHQRRRQLAGPGPLNNFFKSASPLPLPCLQQVHVAADALRDDVEGLCKTAEFLNNRFSAERLEARLRVYKERLIAVVAAAVEERKAMKARTVRCCQLQPGVEAG